MTGSDYVLVVDDDPDMVEIITAVLERAGYVSRGAENGMVALEEAANAKPSVVLLDMLMPVMNGWDCACELRTRYGRTLPIVVVSAAEHAEALRAEIGADAVIAKPFDVGELLRIVGYYATPAAE